MLLQIGEDEWVNPESISHAKFSENRCSIYLMGTHEVPARGEENKIRDETGSLTGFRRYTKVNIHLRVNEEYVPNLREFFESRQD